MARTLLVTNDFPPTIGGIQSYLRDFLATLNPQDVVVFASTQDGDVAAEYDSTLPYTVVRWPRSIMLPTPATARQMQRLIREHDIETVWFGAAAPLALMAPAARAAGARRIVATTHGHEVGWSMLPGARQALRRIGKSSDVLTYISDYTRNRLEPAFGSGARWVHLPSAVNLEDFTPATAAEKQAARAHFGLGSGPVIVCISRLVPRKGQDQLLRAMPAVRVRIPDAQLLIIGRGRYEPTLRELAHLYYPDAVIQEARDTAELRLALHAADVFAMPARTRGGRTRRRGTRHCLPRGAGGGAASGCWRFRRSTGNGDSGNRARCARVFGTGARGGAVHAAWRCPPGPPYGGSRAPPRGGALDVGNHGRTIARDS